MQRANVDFPEPDSPTTAMILPGRISRSTLRMAWTAVRRRISTSRVAYCLERPRTRKIELANASVIFKAGHGPVEFLGNSRRQRAANFPAHAAARFEFASSGNIRQIGRSTRDRIKRSPCRMVGFFRHQLQQSASVGV